METKKFYLSKTLWVNLIAGIAIVAQSITGTAIFDAEAQVGVLALVNMALRIITKASLA